jgi:DNA polymerase (family 10)
MEAAKRNVMFSIDSDAHNTTHYAMLRYGVGTARRGWLEKGRVANTLPLEKLKSLLQK